MAQIFALTSGDTVRITDGTDTAGVTTAGTLETSGDAFLYGVRNGTRKFIREAGTSLVVAYTVPASKKLLIFSAHAEGASFQVQLRNSSDVVMQYIYKYDAGLMCYAVLEAGEDINIAQGSVFGIEIDA